MSKRSNFLAVIPMLLGLAGWVEPSPAHAGFMFDLMVGGMASDFWSGSGSIDFATQSGSSAAGVSAFSFHVSTGAGSPQDYGLGDIATVSWSIDNLMNLMTFTLTTDPIPFETNELSRIGLTTSVAIQPDLCTPANFVFGSQTCAYPPAGGSVTSDTGVLRVQSANVVPEPTSLAIFGFGLAGLGFLLHRSRPKRRAMLS